MVSFPFLKREKITGASIVALTETGKRLAEKFATSGPTFTILAALAEKSPQSISELSIETQMDISELKQRVKLMKRQEYVRLTGVEA